MIYLDNAATTRPNAEAVKSAENFINECFFNPSARYRGGDSAFRAIEAARAKILEKIADPSKFELVFTSCGTEADNQAIFSAGKRGKVVTTAGEHAAVHSCVTELKNRGQKVEFCPIERDGRVDAEKLLSLVDDETSLVSVMHVNNETGAVNDIINLAKAVKKKNPNCLFMSDGVQAFGKIKTILRDEIDFYSVSAHKIGGIRGIGGLIRKKSTKLSPLLYGGGQERGLRSGTENTFGIACFANAAEFSFRNLEANAVRVKALRELTDSLLSREKFVRISPEDGSPYILTVSAVGKRGEVLQRVLWDKGVCVGTGSACNSKKPHSRVIEACGYGKPVLDGVLRLSFSSETTEEEVREAVRILNEVV